MILPVMAPGKEPTGSDPYRNAREFNLCGVTRCGQPTYGGTAWCDQHLEELRTP